MPIERLDVYEVQQQLLLSVSVDPFTYIHHMVYLPQPGTDCSQQKINSDVYVHTLLVALSCVPTSLCIGLTINMVGKKPMLGKI